MEQLLLKIARQLDSIDEESLMALWDRYAEKVGNFEPSKRWEEAVLVFSMIQAKHLKNQLFNQQYAAGRSPERPVYDNEQLPVFDPESASKENIEKAAPKIKAKILAFKPKTTDKH